MSTETNQDTGTQVQESAGEAKDTGGEETITISKKDYEKTNQTLGSLKRELKDLKKPKEVSEDDTPSKNDKADESRLIEKIEKMSLKAAGISHPDDIALARSIAKETGKDVEDVIEGNYFKFELEKLQSNRSNIEATSGVKGGAGGSQAKNTPEYWLAKDKMPGPKEIPDRKTRSLIRKAFMDNSKNNKKYYND